MANKHATNFLVDNQHSEKGNAAIRNNIGRNSKAKPCNYIIRQEHV